MEKSTNVSKREQTFPSRVLEVHVFMYILVLSYISSAHSSIPVAIYMAILVCVATFLLADIRNTTNVEFVQRRVRNIQELTLCMLVPVVMLLSTGRSYGKHNKMDVTIPMIELAIVLMPVVGLGRWPNLVIVCCSFVVSRTGAALQTSIWAPMLLFSYTFEQGIMKTFPKAFSLAEICINVQLVSLCIIRTYRTLLLPIIYPTGVLQEGPVTNVVNIFVLGMVMVLPFLMVGTIKFPYRMCLVLCSVYVSVYILLVFVLKEEPLLWILGYVFNNRTRTALFLLWCFCTICCIIFVMVFKYRPCSNTGASTIVRKYFHLLIVIVYTSGVLWDPALLYLASVVAVTLLFLMEVVRLSRIPPFGEALHVAYSLFRDDQDDGELILTPLYLLIGMSLPLWLSSADMFESGHISLYSGVLAIGVGDSAASIGGTLIGQHKWPGRRKTMEGTLMALVSQVVALLTLGLFAVPGAVLCYKTVVAVILVSLMEAFTFQIDNLVLPLMMFGLLIV